MSTQTLSVSGLSCTGCEDAVEQALGDLPGVVSASADHDAGTVTVETDGDVDEDALASAVADAGYELV
ncbi:heavy-metal-associated domain-containing protein [Halomicroarcula sp. GCM10025709]|uniref:heavy-metal-associated domain-containing protein n=1 Tax=Haloarcula TaxID=2237 RepID=UPI0024C2C311|nr:heavy metal-associated domain-containing protein [Halomicroarcula sp. YJ-61-S]